MAVQGPTLRARYELDIARALKGITTLTVAIEKNARKQVDASKRTRKAAQDDNRVLKVQQAHKRAVIVQTKNQIRVLDRKAAAERKATAATKKHTAATKQATGSFGSFSKALGTSITLWYTARTAVFAFQRALEGVIGVYIKGVKAMDEFRVSIIAASAIMIPSIREGTTAAEKMAIAWEHNKEMLLELELVAARHLTTGKSIQEVYTGMVIARVFPKREDVENLARIADYITIYTRGQQLGRQLLQEVRGLMDGQVRVTNKLAYMLNQIIPGGLKKSLKLWKAQGRDASGQLIILKELQYWLGDIAVLQGEILGTASTWMNTLITITTRILREGTLPAYNDIRDALKAMVAFLFDINEGYTEQAEILRRILEEGWLRMKEVVKGFLGMEMKELDEAMAKLLKDTLQWVTYTERAEASGRQLRWVFNKVWFIVKNIQTIILTFFALRLPVWIVKTAAALAGIAFTVSATVVATTLWWAGLIGAAAALLVLVSRSEVISKWWDRVGEKIREADRALEDYMDRSKKQIIRGKIPYGDIMYGKIPEAPTDTTFKTDEDLAEYVKEKEKSLLDLSARMWKHYWAKLKAYGEEALTNRKQVGDALIAAAEQFVDFEGLEKHDKRQKEILREIAKAEAVTLRLNLSMYGGYYKEILGFKAELLATEAAITKAAYEEEWRLKKALEDKKLALEKGMFRTKVDMYMLAASIAVSASAEALRMMAEHNKKWFKWYQAFAVVQIAINTAQAIMRLYVDFPFYVAAALTPIVAALGAVQAAAVLAQSPPEELAAGGVSETGFSALQGIYGTPTHIMAEKQGRPEAVVPLDKYVVSKKDEEGQRGGDTNIYIMAQDAKSFRDFAKRHKGTFGEQIIGLIEDNNPKMKAALKAAVR